MNGTVQSGNNNNKHIQIPVPYCGDQMRRANSQRHACMAVKTINIYADRDRDREGRYGAGANGSGQYAKLDQIREPINFFYSSAFLWHLSECRGKEWPKCSCVLVIILILKSDCSKRLINQFVCDSLSVGLLAQFFACAVLDPHNTFR